MKPQTVQNILIVKLSAIGDVLMATPVPRALKERYPKAHVAWLVEEKSREVVAGNPYVDEVILLPRARWQKMIAQGRHLGAIREFTAFVQELRARNFDVAIDLQNLFRSGLMMWLSGAPRRIGRGDGRELSHLFVTDPISSRKDYFRASEANLEMLAPLGIHPTSYDLVLNVPREEEEWAVRFLADEGYHSSKGIATLAPATTWHHKHWTEAGFAEVNDRLYEEHRLTGVLLGSPADAPMMERIAEQCSHRPIIAAGKATYKQSAALVRLSRILVGVDTGLLRVGLAMKTPTVALFGPTNPGHLRQEERITVIQKPFPCQPCGRHRTCGDRDCMMDIHPDNVMQAVGEWLHSSTPWASKEP